MAIFPNPPNQQDNEADLSNKRKTPPTNTNGSTPPKVRKQGLGERSSAVHVVESFVPYKSPKDPNEYKVIKLSNGLTVALISRRDPFSGGNSGRSESSLMPSHTILEPVCHFIPEDFYNTDHSMICSYLPLSCTGTNAVMGGDRRRQKCTSVALVVNVGGFNDPFKTQGLSHFTEHMVHYGSEKFPGEEQVSQVVVNFGTYNATTSPLTTSYYNEVPDLILDYNLELFADMLAYPTFELDVLKREVHSVDNEWYLRHPSWRRTLLQNHICIQNKAHPLARFLCGSLETLGNSQHVQEEMRKNHATNYVASAMTLAINSSKSIDELEQLTLRHFSNFLSGQRQIRHATHDSEHERLKLQNTNTYTYHQGISSMAELTLVWCLTPAVSQLKSNEKTMQVIQHILSNSSENNLDAYLRSQELVWFMYARQTSTPFNTALEITFLLTEKGRNNTEEIQQATFDFISMLRDKNKEKDIARVFDQLRLAHLREFHYGSQMSTLETTKDCATRLQNVENVLEVLNIDSWQNAKFNFESFSNVLNLLKEENLFVIETLPNKVEFARIGNEGQKTLLEQKLDEKNGSRNFGSKIKIEVAEHTGAKYFVVPRRQRLAVHASAPSINGNELCFSSENFFLTEELKMIRRGPTMGGGDANASSSSCCLICPENFGNIQPQRLNYRSRFDQSNGTIIPKISGIHYGHSESSHNPYLSGVQINFISPYVNSSSPRGSTLAWLWIFVIRQSLSTLTTEFALGGYHYSVYHSHGILAVNIEGFPKYLNHVVEKILPAILQRPISQNHFNLAKQEMKIMWEMQLGNSDALSYSICSHLFFSQVNLTQDSLGLIDSLTVQDLNNAIHAFRLSTFATIALYENVPLSTFNHIASILDNMEFGPFLDNSPYAYGPQQLATRPQMYSPGETCVRVRNYASSAFTCTVTNVYVLGPYHGGNGNQAEVDYFSIAMNFINHKAFMYLRTQKQLGYDVYARKDVGATKLKVPLMMFSVHVTTTAKNYAPCELDKHIDEFLSEYGEYLKNMPDHIFNTMATLKNFPNDVTKEDVAAWFNHKFGHDFGTQDHNIKCPERGIRKISVQIMPMGNPESHHKPCSCDICANVEGWMPGKNDESHLKFAVGKGSFKNYFVTL